MIEESLGTDLNIIIYLFSTFGTLNATFDVLAYSDFRCIARKE